MEFALIAGPWIILDHYLAVRLWEPDFQPYRATIDKIAAWVRLPSFPMEYVQTKLIKQIGDWLGEFIRVDAATNTLHRGRFARLCVELDLSKPLQAEYKLDGRIKRVEYEGLHLICFGCGQYGHRMETCPTVSRVDSQATDKTMKVNEDKTHSQEEGNKDGLVNSQYGPWMVVTKNRRGRFAGSRFVVSGNMNGAEDEERSRRIHEAGMQTNLQLSSEVRKTHLISKKNKQKGVYVVDTGTSYKLACKDGENNNGYDATLPINNVEWVEAEKIKAEQRNLWVKNNRSEDMCNSSGNGKDTCEKHLSQKVGNVGPSSNIIYVEQQPSHGQYGHSQVLSLPHILKPPDPQDLMQEDIINNNSHEGYRLEEHLMNSIEDMQPEWSNEDHNQLSHSLRIC
ncbi:uncharacterized protein LOC133286601 [Gastrolobium bilobum]|uniref:uncharacterized protein LOC133286601 n=1 Tax=Gastrolobium bilobum TaxID=150636 RepID=UPI002AB11F43|nr:uncharacterized protein LOC133286601 [Gastrolobium bilobum]